MYKISGIILIVVGISGYFTVADDLRHTGEFIGITGVLLAGIILMFAGSKFKIAKYLALQWLAIGVLAGIPLGGIILDKMLPGELIGIIAGFVLAFVFAKRNTGN